MTDSELSPPPVPSAPDGGEDDAHARWVRLMRDPSVPLADALAAITFDLRHP
jgi:hypothetical protein